MHRATLSEASQVAVPTDLAYVHLQRQLQFLAQFDDNEGGVLSCYVDLADEAGLWSSLQPQLDDISDALTDDERPGFDAAVDRLRRVLVDRVRDGAPGVAVFVQGGEQPRLLATQPLAEAPPTRAVWYDAPDMLPLLRHCETPSRFVLVLARRGGVQVLEVAGDTATQRAWAAHPAWDCDGQPTSGSPETFDLRLHRVLRRALAGGPPLPIVIAGDSGAVRLVRRWLPRRLAGRVLETIRIPWRLDRRQAVDRVRSRLSRRRQAFAAALLERLLHALRAGRSAVAGTTGSWHALRHGIAATLVVATEASAGPSAGPSAERHRRPATRARAGRRSRVWMPLIDLTRMALRQGVPVVEVDSDELRRAGGVGCLTRSGGDAQAMAATKARPVLGLVA